MSSKIRKSGRVWLIFKPNVEASIPVALKENPCAVTIKLLLSATLPPVVGLFWALVRLGKSCCNSWFVSNSCLNVDKCFSAWVPESAKAAQNLLCPWAAAHSGIMRNHHVDLPLSLGAMKLARYAWLGISNVCLAVSAQSS